MKVILDFFCQPMDDVSRVRPCYPLEAFDPSTSMYSTPEIIIRGAGLFVATIGLIAGFVLLVGDRRILKLL